MLTQLPTNPHDFALWLLNNLESPSPIDNSALWEGTLPADFDFVTIETHLENLPGSLGGPCREDTRRLGFYPSSANVYVDIRQMLEHVRHRTRTPARFTLLDVDFTYPPTDTTTVPKTVTYYMEAVRLWTVLEKLADVRNGGLLFVSSHDAQLTILPEYSADDLRPLASFPRFTAEFSNEESHADQKRAIIRSVLIEQFRPQQSVMLRNVLDQFEDIATNARHSLAMYMSEFSVAKVKAEIERQNLDDTLSLNKTLAEIQNQLLALPAAILLAGATIKAGEDLRNYAVLAGIAVFTIFVLTLASNQRHTIDAISTQIANRKSNVESMPTDSNVSILPLFSALEGRVTKQRRTLSFIQLVVLIALLFTLLTVVNVNYDGLVIRALEGAWANAMEWLPENSAVSKSF